MTVRVNGLELEYVEAGTGVPAVFCHGSGSDVRYWEPQREAVAAPDSPRLDSQGERVYT
jgi:pimeloyl-ACP methyl ester carboxylesterase